MKANGYADSTSLHAVTGDVNGHHAPPFGVLSMSDVLTYQRVLAASERLAPFLVPTPLRNYPALDRVVGCRVLLKHENHQPTNAFKVRNGLSALTALGDDERSRGVIAPTRGNHGQGVAWAARELGISATICVPLGNNPDKNQAIRDLGATLVEHGRDFDEAAGHAQDLIRERGLTPIHGINNVDVLAGAGTIALEAIEQAAGMGESIDAMVFAVGGGSQAVGAVTVVRDQTPGIPVHAVQAEAASAIHDSIHAGKRLETASADTIADGVATRMTYDGTWEMLRTGLAGINLVSEAEIAEMVRVVLATTHNLVEPAGVVGLAGLRKMGEQVEGKTVLAVLSGANIDNATLCRIMNREI